MPDNTVRLEQTEADPALVERALIFRFLEIKLGAKATMLWWPEYFEWREQLQRSAKTDATGLLALLVVPHAHPFSTIPDPGCVRCCAIFGMKNPSE